MKLPDVNYEFKGPTRVIVDKDGLGVPSRVARDVCQITSDIIFIREDGWMLGAPKEFESIAYELYKDSWTHFTRYAQWIPIERYLV